MPDDDRLLEAALAAFARSGFAGTSVRELTRDLAVSHNFVHQRFGSKERLWYAAVDHGFAQLAADLAATEVEPGEDALVVLRAMAVRYVASMSMRPALLRLVNTEASTPGPRLDHLYDRYIQPVCAFLESLLDRLVAEGRIRPMTVSTLYFMLTNGAAGAAALPALGDRLGPGLDTDVADDVRRHAASVVDLLFDGMLARVAPSHPVPRADGDDTMADATPLPTTSNPAQRALVAASITTLEELTRHRERDVLALHGMGPKAVRILREALAERGLAFRD